MPSWGQILNEVNNLVNTGVTAPFDKVRQKYLLQLATLTGRDTIVYASKWTSGNISPNLVSIIDEDLHGLYGGSSWVEK